mmetsp:Transcript_58620/g.132688  ORF Transcript_58620/g.132688 Transcript_58620/m.132688 type:complete len:216 (+) Transcript_58620:53-700(+)
MGNGASSTRERTLTENLATSLNIGSFDTLDEEEEYWSHDSSEGVETCNQAAQEKMVVLVAQHNNAVAESLMIDFVAENAHLFRKLRIVTTHRARRSLEREVAGLLLAGRNFHNSPRRGKREITALLRQGTTGALFFFGCPGSQDIRERSEASKACRECRIPYASNLTNGVEDLTNVLEEISFVRDEEDTLSPLLLLHKIGILQNGHGPESFQNRV